MNYTTLTNIETTLEIPFETKLSNVLKCTQSIQNAYSKSSFRVISIFEEYIFSFRYSNIAFDGFKLLFSLVVNYSHLSWQHSTSELYCHHNTQSRPLYRMPKVTQKRSELGSKHQRFSLSMYLYRLYTHSSHSHSHHHNSNGKVMKQPAGE